MENQAEKNLLKEKEAENKKTVSLIREDFEKRREAKKEYERQWELNVNFLCGNQYCKLSNKGEIIQEEKTFFWQNKEVFNHIAPIIETRLAKLARVSPVIGVRPKTDDDDDVKKANIAQKLIESGFDKCNFTDVVKKVTCWSETCGSGFYKIIWNSDSGNLIGSMGGENLTDGMAEVVAVSPFEIYPDNFNAESVDELESIIQAKAMSLDEIEEKYGVKVEEEEISVNDMSFIKWENKNKPNKKTLSKSAIVIERYERQSKKYPSGRFTVICGEHLLYDGELPYINLKNGKRGFPFVKQDSVKVVGRFFGTSVIERLIPVQKAYNAVKNRKHEFLNRLSMGVMTVEDGSIDAEDLELEGLSPGKVLVYRQGANKPEMMSDCALPPDFDAEEQKLLNEFVIISGVSDVSSSSKNAGVSSGQALEILIREDDERLTMPAENVRNAILSVAKKMLKTYSQFTTMVRAIKYTDFTYKTKIVYADKSVGENDDVYIENENELLYTPSQKKQMILSLYESGILNGSDGVISNSTREKVLSLLGYRDLDNNKGMAKLQEEKARYENEIIKNSGLEVEIIDDHNIHVEEHVRYVLSEYDELTEEQKSRFFEHIKKHKNSLLKVDENI